MKKNQDFLSFSKLTTGQLLKRLADLENQKISQKIKLSIAKSNKPSQLKTLKAQIAQIKTLVSQRIIENALAVPEKNKLTNDQTKKPTR